MSIIPTLKTPSDIYKPDCAVWELTLKCNFRCLHCGGNAGKKRIKELTLDEIDTVAHDLKKIHFKRVSLIGGEPFCRKDWLEAAKIILRRGLDLTYVSNGYFFPENQQLIRQVLSTKPQVIGFSLDGGKASTHDKIRNKKGSFERVFESIRLFQEQGANVSIITTVNKLNIQELPLIRQLILGKGIGWQIQISSKNGIRFSDSLFIDQNEYFDLAKFIHDSATKYSPEDLPIAGADDIGYFSNNFPLCSINRKNWHGCKAGISNLGIRSNGDIIGCDSLPSSFIEGNIRKKSLWEIWNDPKSFSYTRNFSEQNLKGFCRQCPHGKTCKGGCPDIAISITGHPHENSYCLFYQENKFKK